MKRGNAIGLESYYPTFEEICRECGIDYSKSERMTFIVCR